MRAAKKTNNRKPPVVLCVSSFDPSGGAGLQADIETVRACGGHPVCALACNTIQSSNAVVSWTATKASFLKEQIETVFSEFAVAAVKTGMLGSRAKTVGETLKQFPNIPVIADPVIKASAGQMLTSEIGIKHLRRYLLPIATLATPNLEEALMLAPTTDNAEAAARELLATGCKAILVTSAERTKTELIHNLHQTKKPLLRFSNKLIKRSYHGSGCTLASAAATYIAMGSPLETAIRQALDFTHSALSRAVKSATGTWLPTRL